MKTIEIVCKSFEEWDEATQQIILDKYRYFNVEDDNWYDGEYEHWSGKLMELGFDVTETRYTDEYTWSDGPGSKRIKTGKQIPYIGYNISFSGFSSQGDGASFTGSVNIAKWIEKNEPVKYARIYKLIQSGKINYSANIKRDRWYRYVHWNTTSLYIDWYMEKEPTNIMNLLD